MRAMPFVLESSNLDVNQFSELGEESEREKRSQSTHNHLGSCLVGGGGMKTRLFQRSSPFIILIILFLVCLLLLLDPVIAVSAVKKRRTVYHATNLARSVQLADEGSVRLVGGQTKSEGNVEIYHLGRWGSICDDEWDTAEGDVVCRALGFVLGAESVTDNSQFGRGRKIIWMDNLYCTGNETELFHCPFDGWLRHDCNTNEAAGVICRLFREPQVPTSRADGDGRSGVGGSQLSHSAATVAQSVLATTTSWFALESTTQVAPAPMAARLVATEAAATRAVVGSGHGASSSSAMQRETAHQEEKEEEEEAATTATGPWNSDANQVMNTVDGVGDLQALQPSVAKERAPPAAAHDEQHQREEAKGPKNRVMATQGDAEVELRLSGGRNDQEGRVEVRINKKGWGLICGDGWSLFEAMVVCRQLGLSYAQHALQSSFFGGHNLSVSLSGIKCRGNEENLGLCSRHHHHKLAATAHDATVACPGRGENVAGVICTTELPDLVPDEKEVEASAYLEDRQLMLLQCASEENCLSRSAYDVDRNDYRWIYETRRLLRFTARIGNLGTADFRPLTPKLAWEWHSCHRHYHSMEVFAHFDILDAAGHRVAEGHKASFCLEDNDCQDGVEAKYKCANFGDQGITVGCTDTYMHTVDCQWIDITDMKTGIYQLKISINPEFKVAELSFDNNAVLCSLYYNAVSARVWNCTLTRP